jgi:hypothetical protein
LNRGSPLDHLARLLAINFTSGSTHPGQNPLWILAAQWMA